MIKLTDVIYGLALYYVLFSANVLIGGEKFCGGRKFWKRCDDDSWLTFFFRGLYVFGAVCTGIVLDMAYTSGVWYGVYAEIIKVMFELLLIVTPVLKLFGGEKVRSCIHSFPAGRIPVLQHGIGSWVLYFLYFIAQRDFYLAERGKKWTSKQHTGKRDGCIPQSGQKCRITTYT